MKILVGLLGLILMNALSFAQGISVSPSRIFLKGEPGEIVSKVITLTNHSEGSFNFLPSIKDWDRDSLGVKQYYPVGHLKFSNGEWISLSQNNVSLAPKETKHLTLSMSIPDGNVSSSLTTSMLFLTQSQEQKPNAGRGGVGLQILFEVGIQVYHIPEQLEIGDVEFLNFEDQGTVSTNNRLVRRVAVKIKNTGRINIDAQLRFELTHISSGEEISIKPTSIALLPLAEQWILVDLPHDLNGDFLAVAMLDAGEKYDLKIAEKTITY